MGASASKATRTAGAAARRYPTQTRDAVAAVTSNKAPVQRPSASPPTAAPPNVTPKPSDSRDAAINMDASDPDFARSLRSLGPVQPNPTLSSTSTFGQSQDPTAGYRQGPDPRMNPALAVLAARSRLQDDAEREFIEAGTRGHEGRQFLDVITIKQILTLRDQQGLSVTNIEKKLGLRSGVVERLGAPGVVELASEVGRAEKGVEIV